MHKKIDIKGCILPRIYKRNAESIMLFCWVQSQRQIVPTISIDQAINNYLRFTGAEWDNASAKATYIAIQKEYYEDLKS